MHVLEIEVSKRSGRGDYVVQVVHSPAGEASAAFTLDSDRLLDERRNLQNALLLSSVRSRSAAISGNERVVRTVGQELFNAVFAPAPIAMLYAASRALANAAEEDLRIVLRTESSSPELAALPWETMYDSEAAVYVCRREPLVRHVPVATTPTPLPVAGAVRILGIVAAPLGMAVLDVDKEKTNLMSALSGPAGRGLVELHWAPDATWSTLQDLLLSEEWHVIHFIGHGDFDFEREEGILALVGDDGRANRVESSRFVDLLRQARPMPRLVVLNSCSSATSSSEDQFSGTAAVLVRGGVSAVAAMQFEITDDAAVKFCHGFYSAIAHGRGVDEAVGSGRVAILGSSNETLEWITPVLYLRGQDAHLFAVEPAGAVSPAAAARSAEERVAQAQEALDQQDPASAIPVLDTVLADNPDNPPARRLLESALEDARSGPTRRLRVASLEQRLEELDRGVSLGRGGWPEILEVLFEIESLDPQGALVAKRLALAKALGDLEEHLRAVYKEGNWASVIQIGSEMGRLDSHSGDPNGLVTSACVRLSNSMRESARESMETTGPKEPQSPPPPIRPTRGPLKSSGVVTADAARTVRFATTIFRHGYDKYEVDDYRDLVVATLTALETGRFTSGLLLEADDVVNARFQTTKLREGFDRYEVDDFLHSVISSLRAYRDAGRYPPA
jgi:DivIVA domain-containing protein